MTLRGDNITVSSCCSLVGVVGMLAAVRAIGRGELGGLVDPGLNFEVSDFIGNLITIWRASMALSKVLP